MMTNETVVAGDDARTRLMSLPNTGRGPGSGLGGLRALSPRPNNPNPEREELSYDFIPTGVLTPASQPACLPALSSLSSPFRLCLWSPPASPAEPGRAVTRTGPATALPALPHRLYAPRQSRNETGNTEQIISSIGLCISNVWPL